MIFFRRVNRSMWFESLALSLEWLNWSMSFLILEGFSFTISKHKYCVASDGSHEHTPQCNAVYAGIALAGVELILFSISVTFVTYILKMDYKSRRNLERIPSTSGEAEGGTEDAQR